MKVYMCLYIRMVVRHNFKGRQLCSLMFASKCKESLPNRSAPRLIPDYNASGYMDKSFIVAKECDAFGKKN